MTMQFPSPLAKTEFETYVLRVVLATYKEGGAASRLDRYELAPPADAWEFPKYPDRTMILPPETGLVEELKKFIQANEMFLREPDCWLGTWIHPQTGCVYLDITTRCSHLEEARQMALELSERAGRRIVALYNSARRETVYL